LPAKENSGQNTFAEKIMKIRPPIIGILAAILVTAIAGGLWDIGREDWVCIVLWPGMMIGWAFVFGDNIRSFHEVTGVITLISLVTNGFAGLIIGAFFAFVVRCRTRRRQKVCEPTAAASPSVDN
jgi:hypothetical protein